MGSISYSLSYLDTWYKPSPLLKMNFAYYVILLLCHCLAHAFLTITCLIASGRQDAGSINKLILLTNRSLVTIY